MTRQRHSLQRHSLQRHSLQRHSLQGHLLQRHHFRAAVVGLVFAWTATLAWAQTPELDEEAWGHAEALSHAFRQAVAKVLPTVVTIKTSSASRPGAMPGMGESEEGEDPFQGSPLDELFGDRFGQQRVPRREGLGSGVIIDAAGIVLTNNHVVAGMDTIVVELSDGREFTASDIKTDPESDIAVVRITDAGNLPAATLGDSDKLQIGDWVLAVGSPFGLEDTVSAGIISAKGRALQAAERAQFLQTDAAINPGNSGGPLVNLRGEVVGINTAIASQTGAYQGVGFAIPASLVKWVSGQLVRDGRVRRSYLGVGVGVLTAELAEQFGGAVGRGVVVQRVYPGSPADKAGMQFGDVITMFEQMPIRTPGDLQQAVEKIATGAGAAVTFLRDGKSETVTVVLEELPALAAEGRAPGRVPRRMPAATGIEKKMGIEIQDLTARVAQELGYNDRTSGVLVVGVDPRSAAAEKGISRGMLIVKVRKTEVANIEQFRKALEGESLERGVPLLVVTPTEERLIVVKSNE
ncbi:MAG: Do family serine endopeptidase [Pirellulaceae bacterium]